MSFKSSREIILCEPTNEGYAVDCGGLHIGLTGRHSPDVELADCRPSDTARTAGDDVSQAGLPPLRQGLYGRSKPTLERFASPGRSVDPDTIRGQALDLAPEALDCAGWTFSAARLGGWTFKN